MNPFARWVSIVLHPFVTTLLLAAAVELERGTAAAARTMGVIALLLIVPVGLLTVIQTRRGAWGTVDASEKRDRPILFAVGALGTAALLLYFMRDPASRGLVAGTGAVLAMIILCAAITPWVKLSLHTATAALAASLLLQRGSPIGGFMLAALPVLGWSRVELRRHRWSEVLLGLVVGAATGVAIGYL